MPCKHIHAVQLSIKIAGDVQEQSAPAAIEEAEPKIPMPHLQERECQEVGNPKTQLRMTSVTLAQTAATRLLLTRDFAG